MVARCEWLDPDGHARGLVVFEIKRDDDLKRIPVVILTTIVRLPNGGEK